MDTRSMTPRQRELAFYRCSFTEKTTIETAENPGKKNSGALVCQKEVPKANLYAFRPVSNPFFQGGNDRRGLHIAGDLDGGASLTVIGDLEVVKSGRCVSPSVRRIIEAPMISRVARPSSLGWLINRLPLSSRRPN